MLNEDKIFNLYDAESLAIFRYGSRVYETITDKSDFDYIVIKEFGPKEEKIIEQELVNINIISKYNFIKDLNDCEISALECWYLPAKHILRNNLEIDFTLDLVRLRHSISEKASHSYVKAKKKFIVPEDKDIYVGKKSLFHSLRIISFGIQLATHKKIIDYTAANHLHKDIMNSPSEDWNDYHSKYKSIFNNMMSDFRKLAPKE